MLSVLSSQGSANRPPERSGERQLKKQAPAGYFRAKLLAALEAAGLTLPRQYPKGLAVDCTSVGRGEPALIYLGRYLYRASSARRTSSPLRRRTGEFPLSQRQDQADGGANRVGRRFSVAADDGEIAFGLPHWWP